MLTKLIFGLGNPEPYYYQLRHNDDFALLKALQAKGLFASPNETRHNAGFRVISKITGKTNVLYEKRLPGEEAAVSVPNGTLVMVCPFTGMNTSGAAARTALALYNVRPADMLLVYDDISLPLGQIRLQAGNNKPGSGGGHNGVRSVITETNSNEFDRLKVGVGPVTADMPVVEFVLSTISAEHNELYIASIAAAAEAAKLWAASGVQTAMNAYNGRRLG
jgi:PTH1 family peptidyl-tRNA hydrolase